MSQLQINQDTILLLSMNERLIFYLKQLQYTYCSNIQHKLDNESVFDFLTNELVSQLLQLLPNLYPRKEVQFTSLYFNLDDFIQVSQTLSNFSQFTEKFVRLNFTDDNYFELIQYLYHIIIILESYDETPCADLKLNQNYQYTDIDLKLAINILGDKAIEQQVINRKKRCIAM